MHPSQPVPPPTPTAAPALVAPKPAQRRIAKPYSYPSIMTLPAKVSIPLNEHDSSFCYQTGTFHCCHSWSAQDFQVRYSVDFLRLEGYEAGELSFLFDMPPKGFVTLTPSFWSWTL